MVSMMPSCKHMSTLPIDDTVKLLQDAGVLETATLESLEDGSEDPHFFIEGAAAHGPQQTDSNLSWFLQIISNSRQVTVQTGRSATPIAFLALSPNPATAIGCAKERWLFQSL